METEVLSFAKIIANTGAIGGLLILTSYALYKGVILFYTSTKEQVSRADQTGKTMVEMLEEVHEKYQEQISAERNGFSEERSALLREMAIDRKETITALNNLTTTLQKMYDLVEKRDGDIRTWNPENQK